MSENQENISESASAPEATAPPVAKESRANRSQKVGTVTSDKMQKTVVVRVDRLVRHRKYRRYVRRTSKFMAHDEMGEDELRAEATRLRESLFRLNFKLALGEVDAVKRIRQEKKALARIETLSSQRS